MPEVSIEDSKMLETLIDIYGIDAVIAVLASYCTVAREMPGHTDRIRAWHDLEDKLDAAMYFAAANLI